MTGRVALILVALLVLAAGCSTGPMSAPSGNGVTSSVASATPSAARGAVATSETLVLLVDNQSSVISPVDITIAVDGKGVVRQNTDGGYGHEVKRYELRLPRGTHSLTARSTKGAASLETTFALPAQRWASVSYFYNTKAYGTPYPRKLTFRISDKMPLFD